MSVSNKLEVATLVMPKDNKPTWLGIVRAYGNEDKLLVEILSVVSSKSKCDAQKKIGEKRLFRQKDLVSPIPFLQKMDLVLDLFREATPLKKADLQEGDIVVVGKARIGIVDSLYTDYTDQSNIGYTLNNILEDSQFFARINNIYDDTEEE